MSTEVHFTHPILSVETFPVQGPERVHRYVRMRTQDWVNCVPVTADGQVVLVRQFRHGIEQSTLEVPGGAIDPGEEPQGAGVRELREETGFGGGVVKPMGWVWANPAIQTNKTFLYLIEGAQRLGEPEPDPTENIEVVLVPAADIAKLLHNGDIRHSLAVVALQRALLMGALPG